MKLLFALVLALPAVASARPSTWKMTCRDGYELVRSQGAVVMNYDYSSSAGYLYDRFVASDYYCEHGEHTVSAYVKSLDNSECFIGYRCQQRNR